MQNKPFVKKVNLSAPRHKCRSLLRVDPGRRSTPRPKRGASAAEGVNRENPAVLPTKLIINFRGSLLRQKGDHKSGGQRRKVSEVRAMIAYYLSREIGISKAEIAQNLDVGTLSHCHGDNEGGVP